MGTLTINGQSITVDDSFAKLSPADQEKTVNEIASQMQQSPSAASNGPPAGAVPGSQAYKDWAIAQAKAGKPLPQVSQVPAPSQTGPLDQVLAGYTSALNSVPVAGPAILNAAEAAKARMYGMPQAQVTQEDQAREAANPTASTIGGVTGTVVPYMAAAEIPGVNALLGMAPEAGLLQNTIASGLSSAALGGADTLMRGGDLGQAARDAGLSGAIGAVIPGAGAALSRLGQFVPKALDWSLGGVPSFARTAADTQGAGERALGRAMGADTQAGLAMAPATDASAISAGQDVINLDRGGPAVRRLARIAAAGSPEAKAILESATDRGVPSLDTADFLQRLVGGSADDLALRQGLRDASRLANGPAYAAANANPAAESIYTPRIQQLMLAPEMQQAIRDAEGIGKTRAAIAGAPRVAAPFKFDANGNLFTTPIAPPSLAFWDNVQQALRRQIESLGPRERAKLSDLTNIRNGLLGELDTVVPEFRTARQGAAGFFGAEDALDAGRQYVLQPRNLPEALQAVGKMSAPDKKAFAIGAASSAIDKLKTGSTYSVVKSTFTSPAQREFWLATLGPQKAAQLENYVKVQGLMDESKRAIQGGSHTYDLMVAGGLGAAGATGSYFAPGNNFSTAAYFLAALRAGRGVLGRKVDQAVSENVAKLLASGDKASLNKVVANASMSPRWKAALDALVEGSNAIAHAGAVSAPSGASAPNTGLVPWQQQQPSGQATSPM